MWSRIAVAIALALHTSAHIQKPLSFGSSPHAHVKPSSVPGFGEPTLGESFTKFAASDVDVSALKAFMPTVTSLNALNEDTFTTLTHPAYPKHGVRVRKSKFCDGTVDAYTGYVDVEARHIFFSFFKSRGDWTKDPVMMWTNGGPGCSSAIGLFMELGPCRISDESGPKHFDHSWNDHTNIFFVDQPIGVGFSYADHGESVSTTQEAAIDIAFLSATFFEHFSELKGREFHMAGESYGGRYIPLFASAVHDLNPRLEKAGFAPVNLSSILIGNGLTDFATMYPSYYDMQCSAASVPPIQDIGTCTRMKQAVPRCKKMIKESCQDVFDGMGCSAALMFCGIELYLPYYDTGMNPYDISRKCEGSITETLCYPVTKHISNYLSLPETRKALGVDSAITGNFSSCSSTVALAFANALDILHPTHIWVGALLERGIRTLIYVGEYDWICNWVGNKEWVENLDWTGGDGYRATPEGTWSLGNKTAGRARTYGDLTFATIRGAGHMVPYDKPKEALEMVRKWLAKEEF